MSAKVRCVLMKNSSTYTCFSVVGKFTRFGDFIRWDFQKQKKKPAKSLFVVVFVVREVGCVDCTVVLYYDALM